jgi:hypothetical protein
MGLRHYLEPTDAEMRAQAGRPLDQPPRVDFREMLADDDQAWSVKSRLEKVLGRPHLSTQLADQLDHETGCKLADRLDTLVSQAVSEAVMAINQQVASVTEQTVDRLRVETESARKQLREATRERFTGTSRS